MCQKRTKNFKLTPTESGYIVRIISNGGPTKSTAGSRRANFTSCQSESRR